MFDVNLFHLIHRDLLYVTKHIPNIENVVLLYDR